jgi:hypothetical protein
VVITLLVLPAFLFAFMLRRPSWATGGSSAPQGSTAAPAD